MIDPTAMILADRATRRHVGSARPDAPADPGREPRPRAAAARHRAAATLRRLADRLDRPPLARACAPTA